MSRKRACSYLVGLFVVLALAGCGGGWFAQQREPWRHDAEVACLKSGQVKITDAVAQMPAISGPGMCGADFPLKVAALGGEGAALGYSDDPRPPAAVGAFSQIRPAPPPAPRYDAYPQSSYSQQQQAAYPPPGAPLSLKPPGSEPEEDESEIEQQPVAPTYNRPGAITRTPLAPPSSPARPYATRDGLYDPPRTQPPDPYITPPARDYEPQGRYAQPAQTYEPQGRYGAQPQRYESRYGKQPPQSYDQRYDAQQPVEPLPPLGPPTAMPASGPATIKPAATLACPMVSALDQWISGSVQPAAVRWFGQPVIEIKQISAYSCRGMNGNPHAHISEHAFGNALDVAAFTLADGRKVTVKDGWRGLPEERGFLRDVHAAACQQFTTVLGPGSNVYHYDHLHVDLMRRSSGRSICNPAAIPGDAVASRRSEPPTVTGSIGRRPRVLGYADDDASRGRALPSAIAGED
jgi:hypothetical protein